MWWSASFGQNFSGFVKLKWGWPIKKKVSYEKLEKMLYSILKYNAEINEYCEKLQTHYGELSSIDPFPCTFSTTGDNLP